MSGPLQLTIAAGSATAPQPGPGVDPDGSSEPVDAAFGTSAGSATPAGTAQPGAEPDLAPLEITFGSGPASGTATSDTPPPGTPPPGGAPDTSSRRPAGGSTGTDDRNGGGPNTDGPGGNPTGSPSNPRRGRTGRSRRPAGGPSSGPAITPITSASSRSGRISTLLRGLAAAGGSPTGRIAGAKPSRAPRPGRAASGPLLGGLGSLLAGWGSALAGLLRSGQGRASRFTPETWRVIAILAIGGLVALTALAAPVDLAAPDSAPTSAAAPAGATTTARRVLDLADSQVGTVEGRGGGTRYHQDYGIAPAEPWCAVFVWDMFREAGASGLIGPKTAYTPTLASWFRQRGQWSSTPTVGALVFYDWPGDSKSRIQHVGIVESIGPNTITTLEGNTSSGVAGSQANGGGVWRRTRPRNGSIAGYGLPSYALAS